MITPPEMINQDPEVTPFIRDWARHISYCTFPCTWPEVSLILRNSMHPFGSLPFVPTVLNSFEPVGRIFVLQIARFEHILSILVGVQTYTNVPIAVGYSNFIVSVYAGFLYPSDFPLGTTLQGNGGNPVDYMSSSTILFCSQWTQRWFSDEPLLHLNRTSLSDSTS